LVHGSSNCGVEGRLALTAAGTVIGAATVTLSLLTAPVTPIALATAGLGLVSGVAVPGAERWRDWLHGKRTLEQNGFHFLLGPSLPQRR